MQWFLASLLFIIGSTAFGQQKQTYFEGKELKQYEGEWVGTNGTDTLRIILQFKERHEQSPNLFVDAIYGWHCYTKNGVKESNTIVYPLNIRKSSIVMGKAVNGQIFMTFNDNQRNKGNARISFAIIPGTNNTKATWKVERIIPQEGTSIIVVDKNGKPLTKNRHGKIIPPPPPLETDYPLSEITAIPEWTMTKVN